MNQSSAVKSEAKDRAREGVDRRAIAVLSAGHLFTDVSQVAVVALLPFLISERGISYAEAGMLVLAATASSSVVQPLFGLFSDRLSLPALMPMGTLLGGVGIALVGVAPNYGLTLLAVVLSGLGVAAFHPEASRFANYASGANRATGMSYFSVGGNADFALGPVLAVPLVLHLGLPGTLFLALPAAVMAAGLALELPRLKTFRPAAGPRGSKAAEAPAAWGAFLRLSGVITVRSVVHFGLITFVPLYYVEVLGSSEARASVALSLMLSAGVVGTLLGGRLADRFGRRAVLLVSMLVLPPAILGFVFSGKAGGMLLLAFIGAAAIASFSVTIVMGQEYLPGSIGLASGVTIGLAIGTGGLAAPVLGLVADGFGLPVVMAVLAALPALGVLLALSLPGKPIRGLLRRASASR